jgi:hypothetical protein
MGSFLAVSRALLNNACFKWVAVLMALFVASSVRPDTAGNELDYNVQQQGGNPIKYEPGISSSIR